MASRPGGLAPKLAVRLAAALMLCLVVPSAGLPDGLVRTVTSAAAEEVAVAPAFRVVDAGDEYRPRDSSEDGAGSGLGEITGSEPALRNVGLSDQDVRRYRHIFELQGKAAWDAADAEIAQLQDQRLLGHVLRQRYLHPGFSRVGYDEIRAWLKRYGDQAGADRIYALAELRQPRGAPPPPELPDAGRLGGALEEKATWGPGGVAPRSRAAARPSEPPVFERIEDCLHEGRLSAAIRLLGDDVLTRRLDDVGYDSLRARIAAALFYNGNVHAALTLAAASAARSGDAVRGARWIAGLASWRLGDPVAAGRYFEAMAGDTTLTPWEAAAAAYWVARAETRQGHVDRAGHWLDRAARYDRTFYGLIARRTLGRAGVFRWQVPPLTVRHLAAIGETAPGHRAIALLQVGEDDLAEQELRRIHPRENVVLAEALLALADRAGLPALALQVGNAVAAPDGGTYDAALYPLPHWNPPDGFALDRALLFAIMRQESRFEPRLVSRAGAAGLMQLMPETARDMGIREGDPGGDDSATEHRRLFDPQWNLLLGQRYVASLLASPLIAGNLVHLAVAYNAGPTNLARWRHELEDIGDPLLFVESIPMHETRDYVHKVLSNLWIYQMRLGQPSATLDAVAAGAWPVYLPAADRNAQAVGDGGTQVAIHDEN